MLATEAEPLLLPPHLTQKKTALALQPDVRPAPALIPTTTGLGDLAVFVMVLPL